MGCYVLLQLLRVEFYRKESGGDTKLVPVIQGVRAISVLEI